MLSKDKAPQVRLEIEQQSTTGAIKRIYKKLGEGDDLYSASGNMLQYKGFMITDIVVDTFQPSRSHVKFSNGESLMLKEVIGNVTADHKARIQIRETIKAHFRKRVRSSIAASSASRFSSSTRLPSIASMMKTAMRCWDAMEKSLNRNTGQS